MLTSQHIKCLKVLNDTQKKTDICPSYYELANVLGLKSRSSVHKIITDLEKEKYIKRQPHLARSISILKLPPILRQDSEIELNDPILASQTFVQARELPLWGVIAAGKPLHVSSTPGDSINVPTQLLKNGPHYTLKVAGDSMKNAGIMDKDFVIIQKEADFKKNDIIVALVKNHETTLKYYIPQKSNILLRAANENYADIIVKPDELEIQGRLVGVIRKY